MLPFLFKRISLAVITLFVVITITFFMVMAMPGNPFSRERKIPAAIEKELRKKYKMEGTSWELYTAYMKDLAKGDLRMSVRYRDRTVNEILKQTLPVSITLGSIAFVISMGIGISLGAVAAIKHKTWIDQVAMLLAVFSISIPTFVIAPLGVLYLALQWKLFPVAGWGSPEHFILPSIFLALPYSAYIARLTRNSLLDVLNQDYIRTARAKGMSEAKAILFHALRVSLLPVLSYAGPLAAFMLTGSLIVEEIFNIPGMGAFFVNGALNRDHFLLLGVVIVYSILLIGFSIVVDILYTFLDPRIKLE